jgi:hypothetical protein
MTTTIAAIRYVLLDAGGVFEGAGVLDVSELDVPFWIGCVAGVVVFRAGVLFVGVFAEVVFEAIVFELVELAAVLLDTV